MVGIQNGFDKEYATTQIKGNTLHLRLPLRLDLGSESCYFQSIYYIILESKGNPKVKCMCNKCNYGT